MNSYIYYIKQITPHNPLPLPLWLAELLCVQTTTSSSSPILTIDLPPLLSSRVLNALRADPISVDLRQQARYFYAFATRVLELFEEEDVVDVLEMSWKRRSKGVGDVAHASSSSGAGGGGGAGGAGEREVFLRGLEEGERDCKFFSFSLFSFFPVIMVWFGGGQGRGGVRSWSGGVLFFG